MAFSLASDDAVRRERGERQLAEMTRVLDAPSPDGIRYLLHQLEGDPHVNLLNVLWTLSATNGQDAAPAQAA